MRVWFVFDPPPQFGMFLHGWEPILCILWSCAYVRASSYLVYFNWIWESEKCILTSNQFCGLVLLFCLGHASSSSFSRYFLYFISTFLGQVFLKPARKWTTTGTSLKLQFRICKCERFLTLPCTFCIYH